MTIISCNIASISDDQNVEESIEQRNRKLHEKYAACIASFESGCCMRVDLFSASSSEVSVHPSKPVSGVVLA